MDFSFPPETEAFRREVRAFLEEHWDLDLYAEEAAGLAGPGGPVGTGHPGGAWHAKLQEACLVAPHWPVEHGGRGAGLLERLVLFEELERLGAPGPGNPIGTGWVGPTLLAFGTEEQRKRFLPPILTGEEVWCQLFSEPGAGSDLGSLATRAEKDGGGWVVHGQKTWTSLGSVADWGILLARTDSDVPKHQGLTFFLIEMDQPGVEVRPIRQMTGRAEFCDVFLDGARASEVVGDLHDGWRVAMTTLANERFNLTTGTGAFWGGGPSVPDLIALGRRPEAGEADLRRRCMLAGLHVEDRVLRLMRLRVVSALDAGETPDVLAAVQKLLADRLGRLIGEASMELLGPAGLLWGDEEAPEGGAWAEALLFSPALTLGGGTEEVQKNILGERALGLPAEPRPDKERAFRRLDRR